MNTEVNRPTTEIEIWSPLLEASVNLIPKTRPALDLTGYPSLLRHILNGDPYLPLLQSSEIKKNRQYWRRLISQMIQCSPQNQVLIELFHTRWTESHHFIRELVADDMLLMDMLWSWLPRYVGPTMHLYRGENIDRFQQGIIGTAWTTEKKIAQVFANGLNARESGGVVLEILASPEAIIAGPSKHSMYLGENEFTVDSRRLGLTPYSVLRTQT